MTTTPIGTCSKCGKPFPRDAGWKKTCTPCWKRDKGYDLAIGDQAFEIMQDAYMELRESLRLKEEELVSLQETLAKKNGEKAKKSMPADGKLTPSLIKDLIKLCHPDKHKNSELSTEVTKWLNNLR